MMCLGIGGVKHRFSITSLQNIIYERKYFWNLFFLHWLFRSNYLIRIFSMFFSLCISSITLLFLGCVWINVNYFLSVKLFSGENIFQKGKHFQMFGCIPKNALENILWCLVVFLKMLQKTHFYQVSHIFPRFKQILFQKISIYKHKKKKKNQKKKNWSFLRRNTSCERGGERWLERKRWVTTVARQ